MEKFDAYLADFTRRNKTNTLKSYKSMLIIFELWARVHNKSDTFDDKDVLTFLDGQTNWSDKTKNQAISALRGWAKHEKARVPTGTNVEEMLKYRETEKRLDRIATIKSYSVLAPIKKALTIDQIKHLLKMMDGDEKVLLWLLCWFGIRLGEIQTVQPTYDENSLVVQTEKAGGQRTLFYDEYTKKLLRIAIGTHGPFSWNARKIGMRLKYYSAIIEPTILTPHTCRRTFATHMVNRVSRDELRVMLGHTPTDVSGVYIIPELDKIKDIMMNKHYLKELEPKAE